MKRTVSIFISAMIVALFLTACSWNPSVAEVPITAPWDKMNLPVKEKENARVWFSNDKEMRIVHKAGNAEIAKSYADALEKDGWKLVKDESSSELKIWTYEKSGRRIRVDIGDFPEGGTNVITRVSE